MPTGSTTDREIQCQGARGNGCTHKDQKQELATVAEQGCEHLNQNGD